MPFASFVAALALTVAPATGCATADPAIVSVVTSPPTHSAGGNDRYRIDVTVRNLGRAGQASSTLQSVAMDVDGAKTDSKGVRPLRPGAAQTVRFTVVRSSDAGAGTTVARFAIEFAAPRPPGDQDCHAGNDTGATKF